MFLLCTTDLLIDFCLLDGILETRFLNAVCEVIWILSLLRKLSLQSNLASSSLYLQYLPYFRTLHSVFSSPPFAHADFAMNFSLPPMQHKVLSVFLCYFGNRDISSTPWSSDKALRCVRSWGRLRPIQVGLFVFLCLCSNHLFRLYVRLETGHAPPSWSCLGKTLRHDWAPSWTPIAAWLKTDWTCVQAREISSLSPMLTRLINHLWQIQLPLYVISDSHFLAGPSS